MNKKEYLLKLKDPRWLKKRASVIDNDKHKCCICGRSDKEVTLQVHHIEYKNDLDPWDYSDEDLITLCQNCHFKETIEEEVRKFYINNKSLQNSSKRLKNYIRNEIIKAIKSGKKLR